VPRARVRSHCRFRNTGAEYVSESGVKWTSGSTKRQCDQPYPVQVDVRDHMRVQLDLGLGRIIALHDRSSTSYQICE
jgi:hypothetical protein